MTTETVGNEKKYFFGRVGDDVYRVREVMAKFKYKIDVYPTIFGNPYVVFKADLRDFFLAKSNLRDVGYWVEALNKHMITGDDVELIVNEEVDVYDEEEVKDFVEPLFWCYLRGAEDVRF